MNKQSTSQKLAEINYRSQIANQHLGKKLLFVNEPQASEFRKVQKAKLKETQETFKKLAQQGITFFPYLEIGSEYGLRASLIESRFKTQGFATDISLHSLKKARKFAKLFKFNKTPTLICADAYNLPFKSDSFAFIFMYETLHHFPDPKPPLEEVKRVLAPGGCVLIGSEPVQQLLNIPLWRRPNKLRGWEKLLKAILILPFISHIGKTEVDHGILEESFTLKTWQDALSIFKKVETEIKVFPFGPSQTIVKKPAQNWLSPALTTKIPLAVLGGAIKAICFEGYPSKRPKKAELTKLFICPNCLKRIQKEVVLTKNKSSFSCPYCHSRYSKINGVLLLLEKELSEKTLTIRDKNSNYEKLSD